MKFSSNTEENKKITAIVKKYRKTNMTEGKELSQYLKASRDVKKMFPHLPHSVFKQLELAFNSGQRKYLSKKRKASKQSKKTRAK